MAKKKFVFEKGTSQLFDVKECQVIRSRHHRYFIKNFLDQGSFGVVATGVKKDNRVVAIKILKKNNKKVGDKELRMLQAIRKLDPDKNNICRFYEEFMYHSNYCMAFEMLDKSLHAYMESQDFEPLAVGEIRIIAQQLFVALKALKSLNIVHTDIKPDNVMLVNHRAQPFRVKLIDFGMAEFKNKLTDTCHIQPQGYRAPEVILGLPKSHGLDMWSLGCVLGFLHIGGHLYPFESDYSVVRIMAQVQGFPHDLLRDGLLTKTYFTHNHGVWKLKSPTQFKKTTGYAVKEWEFKEYEENLHEHNRFFSDVDDSAETEDSRAFKGLMRRMLQVDQKKRIKPHQALCNTFITMAQASVNPGRKSISEAEALNTVMPLWVPPIQETPQELEEFVEPPADLEGAGGGAEGGGRGGGVGGVSSVGGGGGGTDSSSSTSTPCIKSHRTLKVFSRHSLQGMLVSKSSSGSIEYYEDAAGEALAIQEAEPKDSCSCII